MKKALVYQKLRPEAGRINNQVRCLVCQRQCLIADGQTGFCLTKHKQHGRLETLNYGVITGIQIDAIEKKPLYHFRPGTLVPSIGSYGCNFRCKQCLNWPHSWGKPAASILKNLAKGKTLAHVTPQELINKIKKAGYHGLAFTYNEPVVWAEFVLDAARLAKKNNLFTVFVTNGSWTKETLDKIGPFIDAANIDFKGFSAKTYARQGAFFGKIPQMALYAQKKHQIHLELTTLLIPGVNDDPKELKKMSTWIAKNLGPKTPWHLSRFSPRSAPDKKFQQIPPTPVELLEKAAKIGRRAGLQFIYIWAPGEDMPGGVYARGDTICPKCGALVISRSGWQPAFLAVDKKGHCRQCGKNLNIR